jgi:hypothetical protein
MIGVGVSPTATLDSGAAWKLSDVMKRLGLEDEEFVTRKQLKELLDLSSDPNHDALRSRDRRYLELEVVGALAAIDLLKDQWGYAGGRLAAKTVRLRNAVLQLWRFGVSYPLTKSVLSWDPGSGKYVFRFEGFLVDAATGQRRIEELLERLALDDQAFREAVDWAQVARVPRPAIERAVFERRRDASASTGLSMLFD